MGKSFRVTIFIMAFVLISALVSSVGLAAGEKNCGWPHQDKVAIANQFLDRLEAGYRTVNIPLIISLYNDPFVMVDVTRDLNQLYTAESTKAELEMAFTGLTGIKCDFLDRQITAEGDMIMIRAMRSVTANEIPIVANCLVLMVLQKPYTHRQPWDYVITNQILLTEEYLPKTDGGIQQNNMNNIEQQTTSRKKHRRFVW